MTEAPSWTIPMRVNPEDPTDWDFPLPKEEMTAAGWQEGDPLAWKDNEDGTMTVTLKIFKPEEPAPTGTVTWSDE
jgi:hypothetical protein